MYVTERAQTFNSVAKIYLFFEGTWIVLWFAIMFTIELWDFKCTGSTGLPAAYRLSTSLATLHTAAPVSLLYVMNRGRRAWIFFIVLLTLGSDLNNVLHTTIYLYNETCLTQYALQLVIQSFALLLSTVALGLIMWARWPGNHIDFTKYPTIRRKNLLVKPV